MAEIERKFLVTEMPRAESGSTPIEQGYLAVDEDAEVRLRRAGDELFLTAKGGHGEVRDEVEVPIEPQAFAALWPLTAGRRVRKVRHYVPLGHGLRAEVDVYEAGLDGLRTAEVEFDSPEASSAFAPPPWFGKELTGDRRYANQALATEGLPAEGQKRDDVTMENEGATSESGPTEDEDETPAPSRAYRLLADEDAATGVRRVIVSRLEKAAERLREPLDGDALAEAIHGARKDLKKARAALRLVREEVGEDTFQRENRALRDAGRMLSASRDAEVKLETLAALVEGGAGDVPPGPAALWHDALSADRDRIVDTEGDQIEAAVEAVEAVAGRAPEWPLRHTGWKLLSPASTPPTRKAATPSRRCPPGRPSRRSTTYANVARTSGTSCACCVTPGPRCSSRPPRRSTSSPTCSATTTISPCWPTTWRRARRSAAPTRTSCAS